MPGDIHAVLPAALGGNKRMTNAGAILCPARPRPNFNMFCVDPRRAGTVSAAVRGRAAGRAAAVALPAAGHPAGRHGTP
jgi:hypothetical protein